MTDQNSQFFAILTAVGEAKQANAAALGTSWTFAQMAVGDANGTDPIPSRTQTKLINERRRAPLNQVKVDPANPSVIIAEQIIPESVGGWWVRELALYDADGDMVAVANCAPTFKPLLNQGSGRTQVIRINLIVSSTANIELKIDPSVVLATREYVDTVIVEALSKLDYKHSVLAATTANITLSGIQTIDGELLPAGARVLVKDQAQAKENGIYVVPAAGAWKRAQDADTSVEVTPGLFVSVEKGTVNGDSVWQLVTDAPIVLGTTALAFEMVAGRTGVSAGAYTKLTVDKYGRVIAGTTPTTLAGHGITDTYTKDEIAAMIAQASALPVGSMIGFPLDKVAPGFLELDGSVKSAAAYPDLATFLGGAFNKGDEGAGNFRLPESRGEFLRGWDHGRGVDAGRAIGSYQLDALQNIVGNVGGVRNDSASITPSGPFTVVSEAGNFTNGGARLTSVAFDASKVVRTASETRPRNLAVMWCIKAWNAPINQGNIDIAALLPLAAQATEINQGTAKVATPAQMLDSANDAVMVTPKKLRLGFQFSPTPTGYIAFPSWMGGLIIQWGVISMAQDSTAVATMLIAFPTANFWEGVTGSVNRITGSTTQSATNVIARTLQTITIANDDAAQSVRWLTVGY
ncbi:phage tail-collar fiber domain-containing protein [Pseudomonas marginalis]|uniref:phage tail-collar fiber domain-containing protein n=1 Tax=Pseudomonas marginalis TaxID=298 RepID=UPI0005FB4E5D|nr:phage tail protein [Pseudomonas marginalis]KJZ51987.1 phage tail collar [Pseudomonas marginalis]KJZ59420.1 phage tail collar [Pseudomonas marginalis]